MSAISKQALLVDNNQSFPNNNAGEITPSDLRAFNVNVIDSTVNQTEYTTNSGSWNVSIGQLNAFTASQQPSFNALNAFTSSQLNINSGVNSFTQSASGRLTALENDTNNLEAWTASVNEIRDNGILQGYSTRLYFEGLVSASIVPNINGAIATINIEQDGTKLNTSSFNSYTASQSTASLVTSINNLNAFTAAIDTNFVSEAQWGTYTTSVDISINNLNSFTQSFSTSVDSRLDSLESFSSSLDNNFVSEVEFGIYTSSAGSSITSLNSKTGSYATTGSNIFVDNQTINADLFVSGNTDLGFVNIRDNGGINLACTGSGPVTSYGIVTNPANGDLVFNNNPGNGRLITFGQTNARAQIYGGLYLNPIEAGGGVVMTTHSGSMFLTPSGQSSTTESVLHVTSSSPVNSVNFIFKPNNNAVTTIVSGSSNIFTNVAAPLAGFVRYMSSGNIGIGGSGVAVPQISASMAFSPTIANNYFGVSANPLTLRGPVSSSAYNVNNNVIGGGSIVFGATTGSNFERAVSGINFSNNIVNGALTAAAFKTTLSASVGITNNNIGGTLTLNMDSSSISFNNNIVQGSLTFNNSYFPTTYNANSAIAGYNANISIGNNNIVFTSGSNTTIAGPPRTITNTAIFGANNVFSASLNADNAQINSTVLLGQGLVALGTNSRPLGATGADWGTVYVGRWNDITGTKDTTAETVFAVGTGTSEVNRRTALLVDSGSNVSVEGSLTVSGSFSLNGAGAPIALTGSTIVTGSLTITGSTYGNVLPVTVSGGTASLDFSRANYFTLTLPSSSVTNINVTNFRPGQTAMCLVLNAGNAASASFNQFTKQPAGFAYSGSSYGGAQQGYDVLTFAAFTTNDVFLTAVTRLQ